MSPSNCGKMRERERERRVNILVKSLHITNNFTNSCIYQKKFHFNFSLMYAKYVILFVGNKDF